MKAELRFDPHTQLPGEYIIEVRYQGKLIGTVCGADGPGIKFISKHEFDEPVWENGIRLSDRANARDSMSVNLLVRPGTLNGEARDLGMKA